MHDKFDSVTLKWANISHEWSLGQQTKMVAKDAENIGDGDDAGEAIVVVHHPHMTDAVC